LEQWIFILAFGVYESSDDVPRQVATVQGEKGLKKPRENAEPQSEVIELSG
jgi:hypothetical protein